MQDRNKTAALIRRLGGPAAVGAYLNLSRQTVHNWIARDRIAGEYAPILLRMCIDDGLPIDQPQLARVAKELKSKESTAQ